MNDPDGRYAETETRHLTRPDGRAVAYLARRFLPDPADMTVLAEPEVQPGDRLDLFAARALGASGAWWRIADANAAVDPLELEVPGRRLRVPLPEPGR